VLHDSSHDLGVDPGWSRTASRRTCRSCWPSRSRRSARAGRWSAGEYPTAIGPVDLLVRDAAGATVAVEIKRRGEIDGVEQLTRYLELLNRDPLLSPVAGIFAAQEIKPQARVLAEDRGIRCVTLDYDALRGTDDSEHRLF
jgi:RecB family endonuclease NucS